MPCALERIPLHTRWFISYPLCGFDFAGSAGSFYFGEWTYWRIHTSRWQVWLCSPMDVALVFKSRIVWGIFGLFPLGLWALDAILLAGLTHCRFIGHADHTQSHTRDKCSGISVFTHDITTDHRYAASQNSFTFLNKKRPTTSTSSPLWTYLQRLQMKHWLGKKAKTEKKTITKQINK